MLADRHRHGRALGALLAAAILAGCAGSPDGGAERARDTTETNAARFAELAAESLERGQYGAAARFYREAADARPESAEPRMGLGRALMKLSKPRKAVGAFRAAVQRAHAPKAARLGLGRALTAADRPGEAVTVLDRLLGAHPDAAEAHLAKGVALDLQGKHAPAQASYRAGLEDAPKNVALTNNLGLSKVLAGEVESGIAILAEAAERPAATARTRQNLALAHGLRGDMTRAADIARRDLDSQGVQRNLRYYKALHAVWRDDGTGDDGGAGRTSAAAVAVLDPAKISQSVAGPATGDATGARTTGGLPKPTLKPDPPRRDDGIKPAGGGPIQVAAALGPAAGSAAATATGHGASDDGADGLAQRIIDARAALDADGERDSESHWIQLASLKTRDRAAAAKRRIRRDFPGLTEVIPLSLHAARLSRTKRVHRLRAGPFTGADAPAALCRALRERGQGCLVVRG